MTLSAHPVLRLTGRLRPIAWQAAGAYGAMLLASGIALVVPLALRDVIDAATGERTDALAFLPAGLGDRQRLLVGAGLVVALALVRAVVSFAQRYGTAWVGRTIATDLRRDLMAHLLDSEMAFHDRSRVGQLMTRVTDDTEQVRAFAATGVADVANILALLVGTAALLWSIDPTLAPLVLGAIVPVAVIAVVGARMLVPRFQALQKARGGLSAHLQESLTQVRVVQAFHAEERTAAQYDRDNEALYGRRLGLARIFTTVFPGMGAVLGFATALVLLIGGGRVASGATTVGTIVAFTTYIVLLGEPVRRLGFLLNLAARASASAARVFELLDRQPAMTAEEGAGPEAGWQGTVRWEGVTFGYGDTTVLHGIDLTIAAGEHVAIVGRSGSGKSALVSLLVRLYDPDRGRVTLDGHDIAEVSRQTLQRAIAVVEQDAFLFSASVTDNIAFAKPGASQAQVEAAARTAGAHDFVMRLDEGYDTVVGERGVTLSGGQRQRIALARALLVRSPVLVLDDAVSAVDARTERGIRTALADVGGEGVSGAGGGVAGPRRRPTVISVAQRLSTILAADRIVVLEHGRVVEQGTHEQLIDAEGPYAALFRDTLQAVAGQVDAAVGLASHDLADDDLASLADDDLAGHDLAEDDLASLADDDLGSGVPR